MSLLPDNVPLSQVTDTEIRDALTRALFEVDLLLRLAALREITVTLDLVERTRDGLLKPYTTVIAHGLDRP